MPRILVADDAPALRVLLLRTCQAAGYDVVVAADGREAIAILESGERIDVVVADHSMPGASGLEVIAAAHRLDPTTPGIIVTAHHDLDLAMTAIAEGADAFLPKPFKPQHLVAVIEQALERRRLAGEAQTLELLAPLLDRVTGAVEPIDSERDAQTTATDLDASRERILGFADAVATRIGVSRERLVAAFIDALDEDDVRLEVDVVGVAVRHAMSRLERR
jgi:DNA-binding NtrC family response regulator